MRNNVYTLPPRGGNRRPSHPTAYDDLTDTLLLAQAEAGTLNPAIVAALLAAVRQRAMDAAR